MEIWQWAAEKNEKWSKAALHSQNLSQRSYRVERKKTANRFFKGWSTKGCNSSFLHMKQDTITIYYHHIVPPYTITIYYHHILSPKRFPFIYQQLLPPSFTFFFCTTRQSFAKSWQAFVDKDMKKWDTKSHQDTQSRFRSRDQFKKYDLLVW